MNNGNPLISIIVPVYNVEQYLDECIESILRQTYHNIEVIIVDDGAKDNSPQICDKWSNIDARIRVLHKKNGGLSSARNSGLEIARGEYIGFVDSDDFIDPQMYEVLLAPFLKYQEIGVTSIMVVRDENGIRKPFSKKCEISSDRIIYGADFTMMMILQNACWTAWNKLYRADLIKNLRFKEGRNNEDTLFMFELGKIMNSNKLQLFEVAYPAYIYRVRVDSICTNKEKPLFLDIIKNLEEMISATTPTDKSLYNTLILTYLQTIIQFLDGLLLDDILFPKYYHDYNKKMCCISVGWVVKNATLKTMIKYYLHRFYPNGRRTMINLLKK